MPALPGLLIEYLVTGAVALLWLLPWLRALAGLPAEMPAEMRTGTILVCLPLLYGLGMVLDRLAKILTAKVPSPRRSLQWHARLPAERAARDHDPDLLERNPFFRGTAQSETLRVGRFRAQAAALVTIHRDMPGLAAELTARSSRDRVARGMALNFLLAALTLLAGAWMPGAQMLAQGTDRPLLLAAGYGAACLTLLWVWAQFDRESYRFELALGAVLAGQEDPPAQDQRRTTDTGT
ncbi:hypothetical protein [Mangrovicoccus algicola]|uniref:Uncharacterized protein n=1 Tax=Mangrovicoccus algicola TaxID=2771008 RepID=A0A8J6YXT5_9RHOB|nr:hypothetical protein [Mangrovicoccus algicola]MBE3639670.1 hypothetical protein [Mangrovicoccus algicola]